MSIANQIEQILAEKEHLAEEILINKKAVNSFDTKKNVNKEALSEIEKTNDKKTWAFFGDMFIKLPIDQTKELIEKDQLLLDENIKQAKEIIKINTERIQGIERKNEMHGFSLNGITATDLFNI